MYKIIESDTFKRWVRGLTDRRLKARINAKLRNISLANMGDIKPVGQGLSEIRVHHGPGYRIYVLREGQKLIVLCGGRKNSQRRDIELAGGLAKEWRRK